VINGSLSIVRLVLGVARLGEADLDGWARSHGLSSTGEFVLGRLFRGTARLAALELDVASATRRHAEAFGRASAVHLFSDQLPLKRLTLEWLAEQKLEAEPHELVRELAGWNPTSARPALAEWTGDPPASGERLGDALRLGSVTAEELAEGRATEIGRALAANHWPRGNLCVEDRVLQIHRLGVQHCKQRRLSEPAILHRCLPLFTPRMSYLALHPAACRDHPPPRAADREAGISAQIAASYSAHAVSSSR
jgi:hypothetical protein